MTDADRRNFYVYADDRSRVRKWIDRKLQTPPDLDGEFVMRSVITLSWGARLAVLLGYRPYVEVRCASDVEAMETAKKIDLCRVISGVCK